MQTALEAARRTRLRPHYVALLVLAAGLTACATMGKDNRAGSYVYQSDDNYVRLDPIEPGAPSNSHPFAVSAAQLTRLLADVKVSGAASADKAPVFSREELETIAAPLASALSKAGPNQDVTFAVTARRGIFGSFSAKDITTGRLFVREDSLNLIFGLIQQRLNPEMLGYSHVPDIIPGTRARRIDLKFGQIEPGSGHLQERRGDWLVFNRSAIPATIATPATPAPPAAAGKSGGEALPAPTVDSKIQEIENRLRVLDALKERGVITEQEYRERRRAVLEQL